jgi:aminoglycoside 3-N-acetyltransferase
VSKQKPNARVTRELLVERLHLLGLNSGQDVIVHSSLRSLGYVEGGPVSVIEAIREVIGERGNLLMPAYPLKTTMLAAMRDKTPFDIVNDRSFMGKITEVFRKLSNVDRSAHPTHSVAVQGPEAKSYVKDHHNSRSPCGPGSPFRTLSDRKGVIICLGSGIGKVTAHHMIEDLDVDYPIKVYLPEMFHKTVRFKDGNEIQVEVLVHDPRLTAIRIDNHKGVEKTILGEMRKRGIVNEQKVGLGTAYLFGAADLDTMHRELVRQGITIYAISLTGK